MEAPQKIKNRTNVRSRNSKGNKIIILKRYLHPEFIASLLVREKIWKQPKCPSVAERIQKMWLRVCVCVCGGVPRSSRVPLFVTPWTVACQAPLSMGFPRQEYWRGLPFPPPGNLPDPGINSRLLHWQADSLPLSHLGNPLKSYL